MVFNDNANGIAPNFIGFIIAEIFLGLGSSFVSGTDSSLLFDTLLMLKKENEHHKKEGFYMSIGNYSESIASLLGGVVAVYSMKLNFFIEGSLEIFAIIAALLLIEPEIKRVGKSALTFSYFLKETKNIFTHSKTLYLVSFGAFSGLGTYLVLWYVQPEMATRGLPIGLFGLLWCGLNITAGFSSNLSHKLPINSNPLNILAFMSVQSMIMRISFTLVGPLFALLTKPETNSYIYLALGLLFLLLGIINLFLKTKIDLL